ncbi:hypothetical protein LCGC14_1092740 [marine sediment metagenome]|uniref:Peptidase C39-like domain-containing protein n=1 Tax=marine sediment metagenome TaxID=412755 RepID=A0A0F9MZP2_9ZZZZ
MKLRNNYAPWGCLLSSAAMVLDLTNEELIKLIGHDGGDIVFPGMPEPSKRQGFHIQEIIDIAVKLGYSVMAIEVMPASTTDGENNFDIKIEDHHKRLMGHMNDHTGIITGRGRRWPHAVAWDGEKVFDPVGKIYDFDDIKMGVQIFYRFSKIK